MAGTTGNLGNMTKGQLRMFIRQIGREDFLHVIGSDVELSISGYIQNFLVEDGITVTVTDGITIVVLDDNRP